jgi:MOSC domain-containing protein YiiM
MDRLEGTITDVCISAEKGERKRPVACAQCRVDHGIEGDAHAGRGPRQVSFLAAEDIDTMRSESFEPHAGDFAENVVVEGPVLSGIQVGDRLEAADGPCFEVTLIGKKCHNAGCAIRRATGTCIMPTKGVFGRVITGGTLRPGQRLRRTTGTNRG